MWKKFKNDKSPSPRRRMTITSYQHKIYIYGGYDEKILGDLFIYDTITDKWENILEKGPVKRSGHTSTTYKNFMVVFAGEGVYKNRYISLNDLWLFDYTTNLWSQVQNEGLKKVPIERFFHSATIFEEKLVIFGGYDGLNAYNDLHQFSFTDREWTEVEQHGERPPEMLSHSCVSLYPSIFVYGGKHSIETTKTDGHELYEFNFISKTWKKIVNDMKPARRCNVSVTQVRDIFYFFGGYDESTKQYQNEKERFFNDLYLFELREKKWKEIKIKENPSPRTKHALVHCNGGLYLFGGLNYNEENLNDLYLLDLNQESIYRKLKQNLSQKSFCDIVINL